jgi:tagatose 1,6-diphosphate aldolase
MTSIGKTRGLTRLADDRGHFTMVALDQRPPLIAALAKARGIAPADVSFADMVKAKRLFVQGLGSAASSMLFDPNYAVPAAIDILPRSTGLIMTLEDHRVEETPAGRKTKSIADWSVEKIRRMGADAVKVLVWYRPDAGADVVAHQRAYVRAVGDACRVHDIAYVLELLVYPFQGAAGHTTDYVEAPDKRAELVIDSVRDFAAPEYGVDLFKLETPLPAAGLLEPGSDAAATAAFDAIGRICAEAGIPWVMLSGGAAPALFERVMSYAYAAGASGFLAGRSIWLNAIENHFPDAAAVLAALNDDGRQRLARLSAIAARLARPWTSRFDPIAATREGDFARLYGNA